MAARVNSATGMAFADAALTSQWRERAYKYCADQTALTTLDKEIADESPPPLLKIEWIEIESPCLESWPPRTHTDILFANERELMTLYKSSSLDAAIHEVKSHVDIAVVTRSEKGAIIVNAARHFEIALEKKERERAQERYRQWWETKGKARFR